MNESNTSFDLFASSLEDTTSISNTPDSTADCTRPADSICLVPKLNRLVLMNMKFKEYLLKYYGDDHIDTQSLLEDPNIDLFEEIYEDKQFLKKSHIATRDGRSRKHALINRLIYEITKLGDNELFTINDVIIGAVYHFEKYHETDINKTNFIKCMLTSDKIRIDLSNQENIPNTGSFVTVVGWIKIKFLNPDTQVHYIDVQFWNYHSVSEMFFTRYYWERLSRLKIFDEIVTESYEFDDSLLLDSTSVFNETFPSDDSFDNASQAVANDLELLHFSEIKCEGLDSILDPEK